MKITIETIAHSEQRYDTCGDWTFDEAGNLTIRVSQLSDWRREMLIAIHELAEVLTCKVNGVTQEMVDKFDFEFEAHRHPDNTDEPGDDPNAPYRKEHCLATAIERMLAAEWGVCWKDYEDELDSLPPVQPAGGETGPES